jgi:hypothetical protein
MAEPEVDAAWRAEFKRIGEQQLLDALTAAVALPMNRSDRRRFVG